MSAIGSNYSSPIFSTPLPPKRLVNDRPVENAQWVPQSDGVFLSKNQDLQWKQNLPEAKANDLRAQLSKAQEHPIAAASLAELPTGTWVIQARTDTDGKELLSLLQINPGNETVGTERGALALPGNNLKAQFTSPDGFHFSGSVVDSSQASPYSSNLIQPSTDGLFIVGADSAAAILESASSKTGPMGLRPLTKEMSWGQKMLAVVTMPVTLMKAARALVTDGPSGLLLGSSPSAGRERSAPSGKTLFSSGMPNILD